MSRYRSTRVGSTDLSSRYKDRKGVVSRYETTVHPKVSEKNNDILLITQPGDRLDDLAFKFYKDPTMWWVIANANGLNSMNVEEGLSIRVPVSITELITK